MRQKKDLKNNFKNSAKEFLKELGAAFIILLCFLLLVIIGSIILIVIPGNALKDLPIELVAVVGFLLLLTILYLIVKPIEVFKKRKEKQPANQDVPIENNQKENR